MAWINYLMEDMEGEQFLVAAHDRWEAENIAEENGFIGAEILDTLTDAEAEATGLDEW